MAFRRGMEASNRSMSFMVRAMARILALAARQGPVPRHGVNAAGVRAPVRAPQCGSVRRPQG